MPDPKKKSLSDLILEAGNEVLGKNDTSQPGTTMSEEDLMATFGEPEKKKPTTESSTGLPEPPKEVKEPQYGDTFKPPVKESGTGSSTQSSEDNGVNPIMSTIAKVNQRFYDLPAQLLETSAILGAEMEKIAPLEGGRTNPEDSYLYKGAQKYRNWIKEISPTNPETEKKDPFYSHTIAGSAGDLLALVTTAGSSRGSQAINELSQASINSARVLANPTKLSLVKAIATNTGKAATSPGVMTGAMQMGTSEWEQAKASGATDDQAFAVFIKNATVGSVMESIPVMHFFKRMDKVTGGGVKQAITKGATQGLEEMSTEVAQQYYSNYTAGETYDATRKWYDGMKESGGIGFGLGFVLGAMGVSLRKKQAVAQTPQEKQDIQLSLDFVNQKSAQLQEGKITDQGEELVEEVKPAENSEGSITEDISEDVPPSEEVINTEQAQEVVPQTEEVTTDQEIINTEQTPELTTQETITENEPTGIPTTESSLPEQSGEVDVQQTEEVQTAIEEPTGEIIQVDNNAYGVEFKNGKINITNNTTKKDILPTSSQGKKVIENYKEQIIPKLSEGKEADVTPEMSNEDYSQAVVMSSENPAEIARVWSQETEGQLDAKEQVIKDSLRRMPKENIYSFGDRNNVSKGTLLYYAGKTGSPIDVQAMEMADTSGLDITPQDIIDFIQKYPNGKNTAKAVSQRKTQLSDKFKTITGVDLTPEYAKKIEEFNTIYEKQVGNKFISNQELADAINAGEDLEQFRFLFDSDEDYNNTLRYVKEQAKKTQKDSGSATPQGGVKERTDSSAATEQGSEVEQGESEGGEISRVVRSLTDKVGSLRNAKSDAERKRLAEEIIAEADGYLLNREGVMVDNDGSFALPNGKTFFDLLDEGKSVYYLDPEAKIARDIFDYQIIANELPESSREEAIEILSDGEAIPFDDAFRLGFIDKAKEMGYDGFLMKEIDGTDSTIQVLNTGVLTLVHGKELVNKTSPVKESVKTPEPPKVPPVKASQENLQEPGADKKDRSFAKQVLADPDLPEDTREGFLEKGIGYIPIKNKLTLKEADSIIKTKGIELATKDLKNISNGMHPAVRIMMGQLLIKKYNALTKEASTKDEKQKHATSSIEVADIVATLLTESGQTSQAASVFAGLSPEAVVLEAVRSNSTQIEKKIAKLRGDIKATKEEISKINEETVKELLEGKLKDVIGTKVKSSSAKKRKEAVKKAVDFLEGIKVKTKPGNLQEASIAAIPIAVYNSSITTIQISLKAGDLLATAIDKAVKHINSKVTNWKEDEFRAHINEKMKDYEEVIDPERMVKSALKDADVKVSEIVKKHYTQYEQVKKSLTEKLIKDSGLEAQEATDLAKLIETEFDKIASRKKRQFLNRKISKAEKALNPKVARKKEQMHEQIISLTNQRVLTQKEFEDLYADAFDLPKITTQQVEKLTSLAEKVQSAKGAEAHNKAVQDLLKYQSSIHGIAWADVGMSLWYSNILSGLSTQATNIYAGFTETAAELYVSSIQALINKKPKQAANLAIALFQGYGKGLLQAKDVLKTGYAPIKNEKIDVQNILERITFKGGAWNPYNYSKYVGRLMAAADVFAYAGNKEMRSTQFAMAMALKEGKTKTTEQIEKRANEILFNTSRRVKQAEITATEEGLTGEAKERRIYELIEESRPQELVEDAKDFAARATFNFEPEGLLGTLTHTINYAINATAVKGVRPLSFIIPFTRIIANVTNRYLDWSPWGLVRAAKGGMGYSNPILGDKHVKVFTPEERQREMIKALTGTAGMIAMYLLTEPDEEGDSAMEITADGTGDFEKNYELQESGWRPYSVKIGDKWFEYKNTPLAIPFAWMGQLRDAQKYHGEQALGDKLSIFTMGSVKYLMDMSFLSALSDFFSAFGKDRRQGGSFLEKAAKSTARTAKSFVIPNLFTQLSRSYQETADLPMKKATTVLEDIVRDMPVFRDGLQDMYNVFGEPVYPDQNRKYIPFKVKGGEHDKISHLIAENQAWVGTPSKLTLIYDPVLKGERKMTEEEYNKFAILAGQLTKHKIEGNFKQLSSNKNKSEVQDAIKDYKEEARKSAKYGFRLKGREYSDWHKRNFGTSK